MIDLHMPSLLFHRGTRWKGAIRGSTNILASFFLRAGYPVTWLTRPIHAGHVLLRGNKLNGLPKLMSSAERHFDGAFEVTPFTLLPIIKSKFLGQHFWSASAQFGYRTIYPPLSRILKSAKQPLPDLIWTTGGDGGALRSAFPHARQIVQCVDIYEAYAGPTQNRLEDEDYRHADAIVAIGYALANYLIHERGVSEEKITVIGQGADLELFGINHSEPDDLVNVPHPRLIWVGVLDKADPDLMAAALAALPLGVGSLVLIGPEAVWARKLAQRDPRVFIMGPRPANEVAAYLKHCDVGLMLYDQNRDRRQYQGQNPLKLYEMAAASLPIVSTSHEEYRHKTNPALVADTPDTVVAAVCVALNKKDELAVESWNLAKQNSWLQRFLEAEKLIYQILNNVS